MYPTISFPSSWDPAQPSTPSSSHRLWYRLFRVWYDHPLKVGHHSLCSFLSRRAIPHSTGKAMGNKIRIAVRYLIGLFFTILMKRIIQLSELWFSLCFCGWGKTSLICVREWFTECENGVSITWEGQSGGAQYHTVYGNSLAVFIWVRSFCGSA